ncbi:hypothetical protein PoB_001493900 [Plakobranchus ocellatus]|uniref:Uncharacterized protein n=1 Tax=Plakobranchus ocellatus TaxID=259542 RepID=A0AAV3Z319_9GAST|nr:hypothetical protein PoB_001493900 [Plakobranchus ocellatus]
MLMDSDFRVDLDNVEDESEIENGEQVDLECESHNDDNSSADPPMLQGLEIKRGEEFGLHLIIHNGWMLNQEKQRATVGLSQSLSQVSTKLIVDESSREIDC